MEIKIVCNCGQERKPIIYVRDGGEVIALIEAECPECIGIYRAEINELKAELEMTITALQKRLFKTC